MSCKSCKSCVIYARNVSCSDEPAVASPADPHEGTGMNDEISAGLRVPMISRRRMLQLSALGVGTFSAGPLLAACGSSSDGSSAKKKGGNLVIVRAQDSV